MFKHSINSLMRRGKKTFLFLFLFVLLTIFLSIGGGMYNSADNMLNDADKTFTTSVEFNYLGDITKNEQDFYNKMNIELKEIDFNKIENNKYIKAVGNKKSSWAYIEGNQINQNKSPLISYAIFTLSNVRKYDDDFYQATVNEILFGKRLRENTHVLINNKDDYGQSLNQDLIAGHKYLIVGRIEEGKTPTLIISPELPHMIEGYSFIVDLTDNPDFFQTEEGAALLELEDKMKIVDNSLAVTVVSDLEAALPSYSEDIIIKEGRVFDHSEYEEGNNNVLLITETIASFYNLTIGDMLNLKLHYSNEGLSISDYIKDSNFTHEADYEIVGIIEDKDLKRYSLYIPDADWINQELKTTTIVRYIVENGKAEDFYDDIKEELLPNINVTINDQGYNQAIKPIISLKNSGLLLMVFAILGGLAILVLFAYLYVIKQKGTLITMISLGTNKKKIYNYILFGGSVLIVIASSIGAIVSSLYIHSGTSVILERMEEIFALDLPYSELNIGLNKNFALDIEVNRWIGVVVPLFVLLLSIILLFFFTYYIIKDDRQEFKEEKKEKKTINTLEPSNRKAKKILFGRVRPLSLKFALLSIRRSLGRSFIVPLVSMLLSIAIILLGMLSSSQEEKLNTVHEQIPVNAYVTTFLNQSREVSGLSLQYDVYRLIDKDYSYRMEWDIDTYTDYTNNGEYTSLRAQEERENILNSSEYFADMHLYNSLHYEYMGIVNRDDGESDDKLSLVPTIRKHNNAFGFDWFINKIKKMPILAYVDDIRYTPDFFNDNSVGIEFLHGYGYESLKTREDIGMISRNFAESNGISMGDVIRVTAWVDINSQAFCSIIDLKVIGIYEENWRPDTIYVPWIMSYDHNYYFDGNYPSDGIDDESLTIWNEIIPRDLKAITFTLKNTEKLSSFREYLKGEGYSQANQMNSKRRAIIIEDKNLVETIQNLENHIRTINILKPIMLILFAIIGFVISYILIKHRTNEAAIIRSIGGRNSQVFFSFFLEQFILFFTGLIPAIIFFIFQPGDFILYGSSLIYFIISYLLASGLALLYMNKVKLMDILFSRE